MKVNEYKINDPVIGPLIKSGSFFKSMTAATGIPKLDTGPQKCVVNTYLTACLENKKSVNFLKPDILLSAGVVAEDYTPTMDYVQYVDGLEWGRKWGTRMFELVVLYNMLVVVFGVRKVANERL